ncbi:MAG: hypothetical protein RDV41_06350 [Planctomycetota bacterium]|nr:hypothetical protein [Planctomycetota bacterium]
MKTKREPAVEKEYKGILPAPLLAGVHEAFLAGAPFCHVSGVATYELFDEGDFYTTFYPNYPAGIKELTEYLFEKHLPQPQQDSTETEECATYECCV